MKRVLSRSISLIAASVVSLTAVLSPALAASNRQSDPPDPYRIVALGDSVSVGYEPTEAIRSGKEAPYGYVDRLYEQALFRERATLSNYAILGLTTAGLTNLLQGAIDGTPLASADLQDAFDARAVPHVDDVAKRTKELAADLAEADLVVLTVGGNDFSHLVKAVNGQPAPSARQIIQDAFQKTMNNYTEDLDKMMTRLHELAPQARIVLADQYLPLFKGHDLYPLLLEKVEELANHLDLFAGTMNEKGITLEIARVGEKFAGKESAYTYFNAWDGYDIHPKQAGYEAMAQAFAEAIWPDGYRKPSPRADGAPLTIVINGKEPPSKPVVVNNTTFLALRDVADAVGATLNWHQATKTAVFKKDGKEVIVAVGAETIVVNGETRPLATPAYFQQDGKLLKTYVPLAVISEGLDYQVVFRKPIMTAFINS
ncbi:stalk domain-containing protein [Paenibacillaceae bacterium WGS1546]|uniref:stalk domain-containing protein n=1 Tax=Cohnella sp. WGS1546 TaxID=3366810 RepID=UPI00372D4D9D